MTTDHPSKARCSKCHNDMIYVTAMPHPKSPQMYKTTFVCYRCNQTRSYVLSAEMAGAYAAASPTPASGTPPLEPWPSRQIRA